MFLLYSPPEKTLCYENAMLDEQEIFLHKIFRSSRPEVFCKKDLLRNFAKFIGKHLCHSLFFNKVAGLRPATLFKKRLWHRCFPVNFVKFLRTLFFTEHLWWLLLNFVLRLARYQANKLRT